MGQETRDKKEKGFGKKLLDAVWKDPNAKQDNDDGVETETQTPPPTFAASSPTVTPGVHRAEFEKYFREVREKANLPGPDYKEFAETVEESKVDESDESKRIKTAFKAFKSMGLTKEKLVETAAHYKKLFAEKKAAFEDSVNKEIQNGVGAMQAEADALRQKNVDIDKQIQDLIATKAKNDSRIVELSNDINNRTITLNAKKTDFSAAYDNIVAEIDHNVTLINQHIQQ